MAMKRSTVMSRLSAGVAVLALLGFAGAGPAGAAPAQTLYTATYPDGSQGSLETIDLEGPTFAALGPALPGTLISAGIDLFGETGYGIARDSDGLHYVYTWDHNTGVVTSPVLISQTIAELPITSVYAADTLADGTLIAYLVLDDDGDDLVYVVEIDPITGVATELVDVTGAAEFFDGLATDPTTEITYAFVDELDGVPQYLVLDLVGGTYAGPTDLTGINDGFGEGIVLGADFDSAGTLWFYYYVFGNDDFPAGYRLLGATSGGFGPAVGADFVGGGAVSNDLATANLTVGPAVVKPALAATGLDIAGIATGAAVLLAAGLGVLLVTRRRATV
jgi:hypothetical protein